MADMAAVEAHDGAAVLKQVVDVPLPTSFGLFQAHAFEHDSGRVYVALVVGELGDGRDVLARVHSECLTGDVLGSLRCDCGMQLRQALRAITAEGRGVLVYATGHEGRGIGLVNKLRAYVEQDNGADTVDANLRLGLPVDARDYGPASAVLEGLGVHSVRLLTNNPLKVDSLRGAGIRVSEVVTLATAPHSRNKSYLSTKERRLGHVGATGTAVDSSEVGADAPAIDATELLGDVRPRPNRPYVVLKFAQSIDGRIATSSGDSKWISGEGERQVSHALRAACDAVLVGVGTVIADDPQLTVRMVAGTSPRARRARLIAADPGLGADPRHRGGDDDRHHGAVDGAAQGGAARARGARRGGRRERRRSGSPRRARRTAPHGRDLGSRRGWLARAHVDARRRCRRPPDRGDRTRGHRRGNRGRRRARDLARRERGAARQPVGAHGRPGRRARVGTSCGATDP
jgi:GTP cyclohydrolase II